MRVFCQNGCLNVVAITPDGPVDVVSCSVVQTFFRSGVSGEDQDTDPLVQADTQSLPIHWWWSDTSESISYRVTDVLSIAAVDPSITVSMTNIKNSTASVSLASTGLIPVYESTFYVNVACYEFFTASVDLTFALFDEATDELLPSISFSLRWGCAIPGCTEYCGTPYGSCAYLLGECQCNSAWTGYQCCMVMNVSKTSCPQDDINIGFVIPYEDFDYFLIYYFSPTLVGLEDALATLWFGISNVIRNDYNEWRYFLTWSPDLPEDDDSRIYDTLSSSGYTSSYMEPGTYKYVIYTDVNSILYYITYVEVQSWDACGYEVNDCPNDCNTDAGFGECVDGECVCNGGHFWFDCSRGCSTATNLTEAQGTITNDNPQDGDGPMRYINYAPCTWYISPEVSFDVFEFNFSLLSMDDSDSVTIYETDADGNLLSTVTAVTGSDIPEPFQVTAKHVAISFQCGASNSDKGFRLTYETKTLPLESWAIFLIVLGCTVVTGAILGVACFVIFRYYRKKREERLAAESAPAEYVEPSEMAGINFDEEETRELIEKTGVYTDKLRFSFGLNSKQACPVDEPLQDTVELTNNTKRTLSYCFYVPTLKYTMEFSMKPGQGKLKPQQSLDVKIDFKLLYTTHLSTFVKLVVVREGRTKPIATIYYKLDLEGALSDKLNPGEILLEPVAIASGAFGLNLLLLLLTF